MKRLVYALSAFCALSGAQAACSLSSSPVNFGLYIPNSGSDVRTSSNFNVSCSPAATYSLKILPEGSQVVERTMPNTTKPGDVLRYSLYIDPGYSVIFGDGSGTSQFYTGNARSVPIYAKIPGSQRVSAGMYSNTLSVDLSF